MSEFQQLPVNPFLGYGGEIPDERIIGRQELIRQVVSDIVHTTSSVHIIGQPRVGKTTVATQSLKILEKELDKKVLVELHFVEGQSADDFFDEFGNELLLQASFEDLIDKETIKRLKLVNSTYDHKSFRWVQEILKTFAKVNVRTLLFIDDFDDIRLMANAEPAIKLVRTLAWKRSTYEMSAIFVSRRSMEMIEVEIDGASKLHGILHKRYVKPLDRDHMRKIIFHAKEGWKPTDENENIIWSYTGGHPWLTEMLMFHSWERSSLEQGFQGCRQQFFQYFDTVKDFLSTDSLFNDLLQEVIPPRVMEPRIGSIELLKNYRLLTNETDGNGEERSCTWSDLFYEYLRYCFREVDYLLEWREVEIALRNSITEIAHKRFGVDWEKELAKTNEKTANIINAISESRNRQKEKLGNRITQSKLLDFALTSELWPIISNNYDLFGKILGNNKKYWGERFVLLNKMRNAAAHYNMDTIEPYEHDKARGYCREIISNINKYNEANP